MFHAEADADLARLEEAVEQADYGRFLIRMYGFVAPVERLVLAAPEIDDYIDVRRFTKHELLRRDLRGFGLSVDAIDRLPRCAIMPFELADEALGWAYFIERGTLAHGNLFRHLAEMMPTELAFTSSFLKCYFGAASEMWRTFAIAVERAGDSSLRRDRMTEAARSAFRTWCTWRLQDTRVDSAPFELLQPSLSA